MKLHDLLVWNIEFKAANTVRAQLSLLNTDETVYLSRWYEGKIFIIRVK